MSKYPKYLNKVMLTKQKIADHEYTVLYDKQGNKYLKLEKFDIKNKEPDLSVDVTPPMRLSDVTVSKMIWGLK